MILKSNPQHGYGVSGVCDIDGCWQGRYVAIEVKTKEAFSGPQHGLSELQVHYGLRVLKAGGIWFVTCSAQHAWDTLRTWADDDDDQNSQRIIVLEGFKQEFEAKWSAKKHKNRADTLQRARRLRPVVQKRLQAEAEKQEYVRKLNARIYRRFAGAKKQGIPESILLYGFPQNLPKDET